MNNCQMIRMMDCETLAEFLLDTLNSRVQCCDCFLKDVTCRIETPSCMEAIKNWLQSEVSE